MPVENKSSDAINAVLRAELGKKVIAFKMFQACTQTAESVAPSHRIRKVVLFINLLLFLTQRIGATGTSQGEPED